jgi:hypothetical protein
MWSGTTGSERPVSFKISAPACQVEDGDIQIRVWCNGGCWVTIDPASFGPAPIANNRFEDSAFFVDVTGDFTSATEANGTWESSFTDPFGCGQCGGSGTWTAVFSTALPSPIFLPMAFRNYVPPTGPPSAPVLDEISNPDGDGDYTIHWSVVSGATGYTLEESDNAGFSSPNTVYSGPDSSVSIANKDIGTYYYRVKASNTLGASDWSESKSVEVSVSPPPCDVSCSTPFGYCTGSWTVSLSCESGSPDENESCYLVSDPVWGTITHCDVTRTYSQSGRTYYMDVEYWNVYPSTCYFRVWVWGGVFGSDKQYCKNY